MVRFLFAADQANVTTTTFAGQQQNWMSATVIHSFSRMNRCISGSHRSAWWQYMYDYTDVQLYNNTDASDLLFPWNLTEGRWLWFVSGPHHFKCPHFAVQWKDASPGSLTSGWRPILCMSVRGYGFPVWHKSWNQILPGTMKAALGTQKTFGLFSI